jgi:periplasmic divalent cation tolerance protein
MKDGYSIIMTTTDSQEEANRLAELLVTQRLAACVQTLPITSTYTWQSKRHRESEWLLLIKTRADLYEAIQKAIIKHHSYETPEILQAPISKGSPAYLAWIDAQTKPDD